MSKENKKAAVEEEKAEEIKEETKVEENKEETSEENADNQPSEEELPDVISPEQYQKAVDEAAALKDSLLRLTAEYDNFRKRTVKEKEAIYSDGYASALSAVLPLFDNLERAVAFPEGDGLKKGLEQVLKQLSSILEHEKVTVIDPKLQPFNPELHNAVMHVDDDSFDENTVTEVFQKGYLYGDKVIRHAMVKVAN